jgi:SAM-dependent methyltransferase
MAAKQGDAAGDCSADSVEPGVDASRGWEAVAHRFVAARSLIGSDVLRSWARGLPEGATVLDLGCGAGVPVTQVLSSNGCRVFGVDASPTLVAAYRQQFPSLPVACEAVETSDFFGRRFDAAVAVGLMFLLPEAVQRNLIARVAAVLSSGGRFLFTAPAQACRWDDLLTGRTSRSLGTDDYERTAARAGLVIDREYTDEGENHYFDFVKRG